MIQATDTNSDEIVAARGAVGPRPTNGADRWGGSGHAGRPIPGRSVDAGRARSRGRAPAARTRSRRRIAEPPPPELWQRTSEPYPGAVVLEDLARVPGDAVATQRIVARFAALRLALLGGLDGRLAKPDIAEERAIAQPYVDTLPGDDAERHALDRLLAAAAADRPRDVAVRALEAAAHAAHQGHDAGAYWLNRTAYALSQPRRWTAEALRAARAIAAAARAGRASRASRSWRRRIRRLEQADADARRAAAPDAE